MSLIRTFSIHQLIKKTSKHTQKRTQKNSTATKPGKQSRESLRLMNFYGSSKVLADGLKEFGIGKRKAERGVFMSGLRKLDRKNFKRSLDMGPANLETSAERMLQRGVFPKEYVLGKNYKKDWKNSRDGKMVRSLFCRRFIFSDSFSANT